MEHQCHCAGHERTCTNGAGLGKNYCKLFKCDNGKYLKVNTGKYSGKACGWHNLRGKGKVTTCAKTTCEYKKGSALVVKHHHAERAGEDHKCVHNTHSNKCTCWCYGKSNVVWRPYTKGGPKRV